MIRFDSNGLPVEDKESYEKILHEYRALEDNMTGLAWSLNKRATDLQEYYSQLIGAWQQVRNDADIDLAALKGKLSIEAHAKDGSSGNRYAVSNPEYINQAKQVSMMDKIIIYLEAKLKKLKDIAYQSWVVWDSMNRKEKGLK